MSSYSGFQSDPSAYTPNPSETALNALRHLNGSETGKWLRSLVNQTIDHNPNLPHESRSNDTDLQLMIKWMGRLFDEFELYTLQFNGAASGTDLFVTSSVPNLETTTAEHDQFEGHLTTRLWTMAFDASSNAVDVYMIPAELLLAFTTHRIAQTEYKPFLTIHATRIGRQYCWAVGDQQICWDVLPQLAKELFADLVNVASGNMEESEVYTHGLAATPKLQEDSAAASTLVARVPALHEPVAPPEGPQFQSSEYSTSQLTFEFLQNCQRLESSIDAEIANLSAHESNVAGDLLALIRCKQLKNELGLFKRSLTATLTKLKNISAGSNLAA